MVLNGFKLWGFRGYSFLCFSHQLLLGSGCFSLGHPGIIHYFYLLVRRFVEISVVVAQKLVFIGWNVLHVLFDEIQSYEFLLFLRISHEFYWISSPHLISRDNSSWRNNTVGEQDSSIF